MTHQFLHFGKVYTTHYKVTGDASFQLKAESVS